jgi:hypothetical protein
MAFEKEPGSYEKTVPPSRRWLPASFGLIQR